MRRKILTPRQGAEILSMLLRRDRLLLLEKLMAGYALRRTTF